MAQIHQPMEAKKQDLSFFMFYSSVHPLGPGQRQMIVLIKNQAFAQSEALVVSIPNLIPLF
jgi:hypothetical protein